MTCTVLSTRVRREGVGASWTRPLFLIHTSLIDNLSSPTFFQISTFEKIKRCDEKWITPSTLKDVTFKREIYKF